MYSFLKCPTKYVLNRKKSVKVTHIPRHSWSGISWLKVRVLVIFEFYYLIVCSHCEIFFVCRLCFLFMLILVFIFLLLLLFFYLTLLLVLTSLFIIFTISISTAVQKGVKIRFVCTGKYIEFRASIKLKNFYNISGKVQKWCMPS